MEWINPQLDRTRWGSGEWDNEPDKISWTDPGTGRPCLIVRNSMGALCGYVAVDPGSPLHGRDYDYCDVDVHGYLTYEGPCQGTDDEAHGVCHVPEPGSPDDVWWFGFDCAHLDDLIPSTVRVFTAAGLSIDNAVYRNVPYVRGQVESLARQLITLEKETVS